ncbi:MAG: glycogen debranching protein [Flavobacteriaceae bacterium]|nr:glycogen debranching protein [Flavobacteriaceae bacterium]
MKTRIFVLILLVFSCATSFYQDGEELSYIFDGSESIEGKGEYLDSPFVTAGNRVYMVGHQNGSFPELGWHIQDEMGGIWNHPIKLLDGFDAQIKAESKSITLDNASIFTNYPFGNKHHYNLEELNLEVNRWQYVPDNLEGIIVQYEITNTSTNPQSLDFIFTGHIDLRPTWLGERTNMVDSKDVSEYITKEGAVIAKDKDNEWYVKFGSTRKPLNFKAGDGEYGGKGISRSLQYILDIDSQETETITFIIAGSYTSKSQVSETYDSLNDGISSNLISKKNRYEEISSQSKLTIPDKDIEKAYRWLKYNSDWLVQTVPEIGSGITAGIPDYPWWFGVDSEYALKGYMRIGQREAVYNTIKLLDSVSNAVNGNGRIIHEMSSNGAVFNKGNINETPQFASLIWDIYKWNGDKDFLRKYFPTIKKGLTWLMTENDEDNNLFPDGPGMMEIHGLESEMIDVAAYTQRAFVDAAKISNELGDSAKAREYQNLAESLLKNINSKFWSERFQSYADFIGTDEEALQLIEDAIIRADTLNKPWAVEELILTKEEIISKPSSGSRPFVLHHNWVVNTPMEMKIADSIRAIRALTTAEKFVNPFGVFVTGIDRDESAGKDEGSFKGSKTFSYTGAVMTLPTAVQIIAENNYGRPDKALDYLKRMTRSFSYALPGSMYEVSPDYGMITQAWNIYGYAVPIISQFFGIDPMASEKSVVIEPQMPEEWDNASIEDIRIGDNLLSVYYRKYGDKLSIRVQQTGNYTIQIILPKGKTHETFDEVRTQQFGKKLNFTSNLSETEIIIYY